MGRGLDRGDRAEKTYEKFKKFFGKDEDYEEGKRVLVVFKEEE